MPDGGYAIANVVGANEYASGVTDNAFTNGAAVCALKYAVSAAEACGKKPPPYGTILRRICAFTRLATG